MKKILVFLTLIILVLAACESQTTGKKLAQTNPTAALVSNIEPHDVKPVKEEKITTNIEEETRDAKAADVLEQMKKEAGTTTEATKIGTTFYPPVVTKATGKNALLERTDALMRKTTPLLNVKATREFGPRYVTSNGKPVNLPGKYGTKRED